MPHTKGDPATQDHAQRRRAGLFGRIRGNFLTGLIVIIPIGLTLYLIWVVTGWIDSWVLPFVPHAYRPDTLIQLYFGEDTQFGLRGFGLIVFLIFTTLVGWVAKGLIGRSFLHWTERTVDRLPVVRSVYTGLKQIAETVLSTGKPTFDRACIVEFPRAGMWSVGFVAGDTGGEVARHLGPDPFVTVYLPTTPNPTSGYVVFAKASEVILLDMTVEEAAKLIISAGLIIPEDQVEDATGVVPPRLRASA
jgi:uncharacterized membrane protein